MKSLTSSSPSSSTGIACTCGGRCSGGRRWPRASQRRRNMSERRTRLRWQLISSLALAIGFLMAVFLVVDYRVQHKVLVRDLSERMGQELSLLQLALNAERDRDGRRTLLREYCARMVHHNKPGHLIAALDRTGTPIAATREDAASNVLNKGEVAVLVADGAGFYTAERELEGQRVLAVAIPFFAGSPAPSKAEGVLLYAEPLVDVHRLGKYLLTSRAALLACALAAIALVLGLVVNRYVLRPLYALLVHAHKVGQGDLSPIAFPDPGNEIGELQERFNQMVAKLGEHQRDLLEAQSYVAHTDAALEAYASIIKPVTDVILNAEFLMARRYGLDSEETKAIESIYSAATRIKRVINELAFEDPGE
ncbi:MAG: HAMP domain-containing protein, partial [Planctomycetes bacterium]|nr:HAMP domain-containing protein [Planctomycetota bacterium]